LIEVIGTPAELSRGRISPSRNARSGGRSRSVTSTFWPAEAYHQRYTERTGHGGCHVANW